MDRRSFSTKLLAGLSLPLLPSGRTAGIEPEYRFPPRLRAGDTVGLITPASYIDDAALERAVRQIESLGLRVKPGRYLRAERGFTAGSDTQRLDDLHAMFADPSVQAVWAARGGYGSARLLPTLNLDLIRRNRKILIGYSDITALLNAITRETGLITYHGPVGSSEFTDYTLAYLRNAIMDGKEWQPVLPPAESEDRYIIRPGGGEGRLWGGNLSLLAALVGTDFVPPIADNLLFIEEVGEKPYRFDRMLTQLRQSWPLRSCAGIILGRFTDCEAENGERSLTLKETLTERLGDLGVPVCYGMPIGHIKDMCTLAVGGRYTFSALDYSLKMTA